MAPFGRYVIVGPVALNFRGAPQHWAARSPVPRPARSAARCSSALGPGRPLAEVELHVGVIILFGELAGRSPRAAGDPGCGDWPAAPDQDAAG